MGPRPNEVQSMIRERVSVTRQEITLAKSHILQHFNSDPGVMLRGFLTRYEALTLERLVLHPSVSLDPQVAQVAKLFTFQLAFAEALCDLLNDGIVMVASEHHFTILPTIGWTTVVAGGGGGSGSWRFAEWTVFLPLQVTLAPSWCNRGAQPLSDGDLYLADLRIPDLHPEVEEALRDAVACFRHELYVPCLAMLAKASEGAWTELGLSLLKVDPANPVLTSKTRDKRRDLLISPDSSVAKKIGTVVELYGLRNLFGEVARRSRVNPSMLRESATWANIVRDSRNAVHYGAEPSTRNTYEKVAALLLGAAQHLRAIYAVRRAAEELASPEAGRP